MLFVRWLTILNVMFQDLSQPGMVPVKNPVGRPRNQPRLAPRPPVAIQPAPSAGAGLPNAPSPSTPAARVQVRVNTPQSAPPVILRDEGPPSRRMKQSPPPSPVSILNLVRSVGGSATLNVVMDLVFGLRFLKVMQNIHYVLAYV